MSTPSTLDRVLSGVTGSLEDPATLVLAMVTGLAAVSYLAISAWEYLDRSKPLATANATAMAAAAGGGERSGQRLRQARTVSMVTYLGAGTVFLVSALL